MISWVSKKLRMAVYSVVDSNVAEESAHAPMDLMTSIDHLLESNNFTFFSSVRWLISSSILCNFRTADSDFNERTQLLTRFFMMVISFCWWALSLIRSFDSMYMYRCFRLFRYDLTVAGCKPFWIALSDLNLRTNDKDHSSDTCCLLLSTNSKIVETCVICLVDDLSFPPHGALKQLVKLKKLVVIGLYGKYTRLSTWSQ